MRRASLTAVDVDRDSRRHRTDSTWRRIDMDMLLGGTRHGFAVSWLGR